MELPKKKAHADLPDVPEMAHVCCQCRRRECGSVRIGSVVYERLKQYLEASGILYRISSRVNSKYVTSMEVLN